MKFCHKKLSFGGIKNFLGSVKKFVQFFLINCKKRDQKTSKNIKLFKNNLKISLKKSSKNLNYNFLQFVFIIFTHNNFLKFLFIIFLDLTKNILKKK